MASDVLRRVRWGNVALACAVLAALAGVVVWPLLSTTTPGLPPDAPRPLVAEESTPRAARAEARPRSDAKPAREERPGDTRAKRRGRSAAQRGKSRAAGAGDRGGRSDRSRRKRGAVRPRAMDVSGERRQARGESGGRESRGADQRSAAPPPSAPRPAAPTRAAPRPGDTRGEFGFEG